MSDSCVYIQDKEHAWLPANILKQDGDAVQVRVFSVDGTDTLGERTVSLKEYANLSLPLQNVDASGNLMEMADMVDLPSLHEAAILYNLRARHLKQKPYTRVGDLIIAVNPFQWMEGLYSEDTRSQYLDKLIWNVDTAGGDPRSTLPPHVYETSSMAYRGLAADGRHQSILVSGESGAGKTETVKIVMSQLASVHQSGDAVSDSKVVQRVLDSHPLLEAFGNAKTVRNDNSSRFGKFIQLQFDVEDATTAAYSGRAVPHCVLAGSTCETYLLEKSRVVGHEGDERTYHIFYQLLAAPEDTKKEFWQGLVGATNESFRYVGATDTLLIEGKTDAQRWEKTLKALTVLDVQGEDLRTLIRAVCVVMQLGNMVFANHPDDNEKCVITSTDELTALSDLMGVSSEALERALTFRTVVAGKEVYTVPLKVGHARDGCDAFAKEIYQQAFDWLVRRINNVTCAESNYPDASEVDEYGLIGLLDIFGFESFDVNRFEQLCINYTNEKLQQKYTLDIFRSVQEEYSAEGIELGDIAFSDNEDVLRLIEGRVGLISVLNEECIRPNGNDVAFVSKVKTVNGESSCLISERLHKPTEFAIQHYAGQVKYDATNFVQKNTDTLPKDMTECACLSSNELIRVELKAAADAKTGGGSGKPEGKRGAATLTVTTKFKSQLSHLMHDIAKTKTRYIRCIKPNPEKLPRKMNMNSSAEQLRCAGVVAAVSISRVAFPNRLMHETAIERFGCLSHVDLQQVADEKKEETENDVTGYKDAVTKLLSALLKTLETTKDEGAIIKAFEVGRSRVYFRTGALEFLEAKRLVALGVFATAIGRIIRGFTARSIFWSLKSTTIDCQANARRTIARKAYIRSQKACISLECWVRCVYAKRELVRLKREQASIRLQSRWRSLLATVMLSKCKSSAVMIQKVARGCIQRPKYRQALKEAEEEARVNTKLAALQKRLHEAEMKWIQADKKRVEAEKKAEGMVMPTSDAAPASGQEEEKKADTGSSAQQQALIDESNEMLEYFRKEVFKLKSANYLLRTDLSALREEHKHLLAHTASVEASHAALKQNANRMSQANMKMAVAAAAQRDAFAKLKHELKLEKNKQGSDAKKNRDELREKEKAYDSETTRLKRELERLRKIIAKKPGTTKASAKHERASFQQSNRASVLGQRNEPPIKIGIPLSPSMVSMSSTHTSSSSDWGHDSFFKKKPREQSTSWTVVSRKSKPRKGRPPMIKTGRTPHVSPSSGKFSSPNEKATKPALNSSLAAAAASGAAVKRGFSPSNSVHSRGNSPAHSARRLSSSDAGRATSLKSPPGTKGQPISKSHSQTSLGTAAAGKPAVVSSLSRAASGISDGGSKTQK